MAKQHYFLLTEARRPGALFIEARRTRRDARDAQNDRFVFAGDPRVEWYASLDAPTALLAAAEGLR